MQALDEEGRMSALLQRIEVVRADLETKSAAQAVWTEHSHA